MRARYFFLSLLLDFHLWIDISSYLLCRFDFVSVKCLCRSLSPVSDLSFSHELARGDHLRSHGHQIVHRPAHRLPGGPVDLRKPQLGCLKYVRGEHVGAHFARSTRLARRVGRPIRLYRDLGLLVIYGPYSKVQYRLCLSAEGLF